MGVPIKDLPVSWCTLKLTGFRAAEGVVLMALLCHQVAITLLALVSCLGLYGTVVNAVPMAYCDQIHIMDLTLRLPSQGTIMFLGTALMSSTLNT